MQRRPKGIGADLRASEELLNNRADRQNLATESETIVVAVVWPWEARSERAVIMTPQTSPMAEHSSS